MLQARDLPAAYFPHPEGLTLSEAGDLLRVLLKDPRIRIIEGSEYAALRDFDHGYVNKLVGVFLRESKEALKNDSLTRNSRFQCQRAQDHVFLIDQVSSILLPSKGLVACRLFLAQKPQAMLCSLTRDVR